MPKRLAPRGEAAPQVEPEIAQALITKADLKKAAERKPKYRKPKGSDTIYIRNLRGIGCRFTLTSGRRIELKPRGMREDMEVVSRDERDDSHYLANFGLLFEEVSPEDARAIIAKQQTNANPTGQPSLMDMLTNERGEKYSQEDVHVDPSFESRGRVVARLEPGADGRHTAHNVEVTRVGPERVEVPGSVDHRTAAELNEIPETITAEEIQEFIAFKRAMAAAKAAEGKLGK